MASEARGDVNLDDGRVAVTWSACESSLTHRRQIKSSDGQPFWYYNTSILLNKPILPI